MSAPEISGPVMPHLRRLLLAYAISIFGTLLGSGVVVWIAVTSIHVDGGELGLLTGSATLLAALTALGVAPRVDLWNKQPVMICLDIVAAAALLSLAVAEWLSSATLIHLMLVAAVEMSVAILFAAASTPMLRHVSEDRLDWALGRQESIFWAAQLLGPPAGGIVTSALGPGTTLSLNGASFVISAVLLAGLDDKGPGGTAGRPKPQLLDGLRTIWGIPGLRTLFLNAAVFGTALLSTGPVVALLVVRELGLSAWQYGLTLGLPCLGGVVAGWVSHRWIARYGRDRLLLATGVLRTVWLLPMAAVPSGPTALAMILALQTGLLFSAGLFNPVFAATRIDLTPPGSLSSVIGSWAATTRLVFPVGIITVGLLVDALGVRPALLIASCVGATSIAPLLLSSVQRRRTSDPDHVDPPHH